MGLILRPLVTWKAFVVTSPAFATVYFNHMAEIIEDSVALKQGCPICRKPLFSSRDAFGHVVWCPHLSPPTDDGRHCNEAVGHGKTIDKALAVLLAKMGVSKDYVIENDEVLVENPDTGSFEARPKVKGTRGRKAKEITDIVWPKGIFTMKEFCEKNDLYPVKALEIFKKNEVKTKGTRAPKGGRGKPAVLYSKD